MAIDNENLEMIQLLLKNGVEMRDALLHAINEEFVEAVELLLEKENKLHEIQGTPPVSVHSMVIMSFYMWTLFHTQEMSWEKMEYETFTNDITPLVLAAHRNNYEIIKIILDRNISPVCVQLQ